MVDRFTTNGYMMNTVRVTGDFLCMQSRLSVRSSPRRSSRGCRYLHAEPPSAAGLAFGRSTGRLATTEKLLG